jgi:surface polysaccharide O-acyltransferase-like enzyme
MQSTGMLEKFFNGILMVWAVLSTVYSFSPGRFKSRYPGFFRLLERWLTYLWFVIAPIGIYDFFQLFRSADQSSRGVIVFLVFVVLIGSAAQWRNSQNKSKPNQS